MRGIGVAVSVSTCTSSRSCFSRSLCCTPKCCSSSMIKQAEIGELDGLAEQRVGADDDVDGAVLDALLHLGKLLAGDEARGLRDLHRKPAEALGEGVGSAGGRAAWSAPPPRPACRQAPRAGSRASATSVLPKPTSPQISRSMGRPLREIVEHGVDAGGLVLGLLVRKARGELVVEAVGRGDHRRLAQLAHRGDLDQLLGHVADALLEPGLARLPGDAAEPVELHA